MVRVSPNRACRVKNLLRHFRIADVVVDVFQRGKVAVAAVIGGHVPQRRDEGAGFGLPVPESKQKQNIIHVGQFHLHLVALAQIRSASAPLRPSPLTVTVILVGSRP